jgi:hypothetical protein
MLTGEAKRAWQREYIRRKRAEEIEKRCSFCGKWAEEVSALVAAPKEAPRAAFICDVCADRAAYTAAEWKRFPSSRGDD